MDDICEMIAIDLCLSLKGVLLLCAFMLPVGRLFNFKAGVTTCVENDVETFIVVKFVNIVQLVCDIYMHIMNVSLAEYDLFIISVVISELVGKTIVSV